MSESIAVSQAFQDHMKLLLGGMEMQYKQYQVMHSLYQSTMKSAKTYWSPPPYLEKPGIGWLKISPDFTTEYNYHD